MGIFEVFGTYFFFKANHTISDPSITSFIGNISPIVVITLSFFLLKERFNKIEFVGMILTLIGTIIISTKGNITSNILIYGVQYIILYAFIFAANGILIKRNIGN